MIQDLKTKEHRTQINDRQRAIKINSVNYARNVIKRLKWQKSAVITKASHRIIKRCDEYFSRSGVPISSIGIFMSVVANCRYQNVAISALLCHLFYLRIWRYVFRIIKHPNHHDLFMLMICSIDHLGDQFKRSKLERWYNHDSFMNWVFADIKATATMAEMFDLRQINRYWKHHRARLNHHNIYRFWF